VLLLAEEVKVELQAHHRQLVLVLLVHLALTVPGMEPLVKVGVEVLEA
jgi:hypothetical protein